MNSTSKQKIAQCFSPAAFIHDTEENYQFIDRLIREEEIGGLTFFHSRHSAAANFEKRAEVLEVSGSLEQMIALINRYQAISKIPLLISIDGEYGLAMRIENTPQYPFAITLGALKHRSERLVEEVGYRMGLDMKKAGIHLNLAPCADVNSDPDNPVIGYRSFGDDTTNVSTLALATYNGMIRSGIEACLKHFPGHGDTKTDSHLGLPIISKTKEELQNEELAPFQYGINHNVEMIMVGHLAVPSLTNGKEISASISREIITGLLKEEMGFNGIVISDALNMKAVADLFPTPGDLEWEAFYAGNDILCFSDHVKEGIETILEKSSLEAIDNSFQKIMTLKEELGVLEFQQLSVPQFDWQSHSIFQTILASEYVSVVSGEINLEKLARLARNGKLIHKSFLGSSDSIFSQGLTKKFDLLNNEKNLDEAELIILSVFVPSHKPINKFGMDEQTLRAIRKLCKENSCILVHFGSQLSLKFLGDLTDFEAVICAYQNFEEAQQVALNHLST